MKLIPNSPLRVKNSVLILSLLLLIVFFAACSNQDRSFENQPTIIEVDFNTKDKRPMQISIEKLIPLETSADCVLARIDNLQVFNEKIYLIDMIKTRTLFVFDIEGKFIQKTQEGKGPGEILRPGGFTINRHDSTLTLYDWGWGKFLLFDSKLNFIQDYGPKNNHLLGLQYINPNTYMAFNNYSFSNSDIENKSFGYSILSESYTKEKDLGVMVNSDRTICGISHPVSVRNTNILFIAPYNYTIYEFVNDTVNERYFLDFGEYAFTHEEMENLSSKQLREKREHTSKIETLWGLYCNDDYMVVQVSLEKKSKFLFYSFRKEKTFHLSDCIDTGALPECIIRGVTDDGRFYGTVEPANLMEFQQVTGQFLDLSVKEEDNPYLIFYKVE